MLTPADIDNKRFSTTRLKEGYDQDEVDAFLDAVQRDYAFLSASVGRLDDENRTLRRVADSAETVKVPTVQPPSAVAEKLLAVAQQAHDDTVAEGKAEADRIVREAGARGAAIVEEATAAAEVIKQEGLAEKYRRNDELDRQITAKQNALADLKAEGDKLRRALSEALARYDSGVS